MVEVKENAHLDESNTAVTPAVPSSSSLSTVSVAAVSNAADSSVELSGAVPCSLQGQVTSSPSLDVETLKSIGTNDSSGDVKLAEVCPVQLLPSSESSTDLSQCSEEISVHSQSLFDGQKGSDASVEISRNSSSSSLPETSDSRHSKTGPGRNPSRKRKHDSEISECGRLTLDKLPNYYTALSIPTRVLAGSAARSSSDLIKDFMRNERDPSPERKSCSVYDKLPAYYSSFTNSTRYDDQEQMSLAAFETDFYPDETAAEVRYGRSSSENYELHDCRSVDESLVEGSGSDDDEKEKETSTENVSSFVFIVFHLLCCLVHGMDTV